MYPFNSFKKRKNQIRRSSRGRPGYLYLYLSLLSHFSTLGSNLLFSFDFLSSCIYSCVCLKKNGTFRRRRGEAGNVGVLSLPGWCSFFFLSPLPNNTSKVRCEFFFSFFSLSLAIRLFQVAAADNYLRFFSHIYVYSIFPGIPDDSFEIGMLVHIAALLLLYAELIWNRARRISDCIDPFDINCVCRKKQNKKDPWLIFFFSSRSIARGRRPYILLCYKFRRNDEIRTRQRPNVNDLMRRPETAALCSM